MSAPGDRAIDAMVKASHVVGERKPLDPDARIPSATPRRTVDGLAAMAPKERKSFLKKLAKPRPKLHRYR